MPALDRPLSDCLHMPALDRPLSDCLYMPALDRPLSDCLYMPAIDRPLECLQVRVAEQPGAAVGSVSKNDELCIIN